MGGYGSGRWGWHSKKTTVEDCLKLDIKQFFKHTLPIEAMTRPAYGSGSLQWHNTRTGQEVATIGVHFDSRGHTPKMILDYQVTPHGGQPQPVKYEVEFTSTPCRYGGVRWWFVCPGRNCHRRVGCLYKPPNSLYFCCRHCHQLTYMASQEAHKYDSLGRSLGIDFAAFDKAMKLQQIADKWIRGERLTRREKQKLMARFSEDQLE